MPEASQDAYRSNVRPKAAQAEERVSRGLQSLGGKRHQVEQKLKFLTDRGQEAERGQEGRVQRAGRAAMGKSWALAFS